MHLPIPTDTGLFKNGFRFALSRFFTEVTAVFLKSLFSIFNFFWLQIYCKANQGSGLHQERGTVQKWL